MCKHYVTSSVALEDDVEREVEIVANVLAGSPERGPSYASGGEPAEPGVAELVEVIDTATRGDILPAIRVFDALRIEKRTFGRSIEERLIEEALESAAAED